MKTEVGSVECLTVGGSWGSYHEVLSYELLPGLEGSKPAF